MRKNGQGQPQGIPSEQLQRTAIACWTVRVASQPKACKTPSLRIYLFLHPCLILFVRSPVMLSRHTQRYVRISNGNHPIAHSLHTRTRAHLQPRTPANSFPGLIRILQTSWWSVRAWHALPHTIQSSHLLITWMHAVPRTTAVLWGWLQAEMSGDEPVYCKTRDSLMWHRVTLQFKEDNFAIWWPNGTVPLYIWKLTAWPTQVMWLTPAPDAEKRQWVILHALDNAQRQLNTLPCYIRTYVRT